MLCGAAGGEFNPRVERARLAAIHALADIEDASGWERETRQERALPGRDA